MNYRINKQFPRFGIVSMFFLFLSTCALCAGNIVARIDQDTITVQDFIKEWEDQERPELSTATTAESQQEKREVLNQLVDRHLLFLQAKKERITVDPQLIEQMITVEKANYPTESEFIKSLRKKGFSLKEYREYLADDLRIRQLLLRHVYSHVTVTDEEVKLVYTLNSARYISPEKVRLRTIFIKVPTTATAEEKGEKLAKAKLALMKLKLGSAFEDIAKTFSDSENAARGGDAGYVTREMLEKAPEVCNIAFSLDIGEISDVIETKYGYYILKVEGKVAARGKSFWEVRDQIRTELTRERVTARFNQYLAELRTQYSIELFPENLP
ncbi:MAG: peptidylprolyl isomerase [bacterium]|nr:peptidylprolyl isomerase [bacterium]